MELPESKVFTRIGEEGFARLVAAFYRGVAGDDLLRPMYPADELAAAEIRLRGFLIQRFGGPSTYSQERGHPRLRMRHAPFPVDQPARDRWVHLMEAALAAADLDTDATEILRHFFHNTATFLINR